MFKLNYGRLLEAVQIKAKRNGISQVASSALDKVMKYPHPSRELAFLEWSLQFNKYSHTRTDKSANDSLNHSA